MNQVIYTPLAQSDLSEIFSFIAADSLEQAAKHLRLINDKCHLLAKFPQMGKARHELFVNLRSFPVKSHTVFYQQIESGVEILRVLNNSRDISQIFEDAIDETKRIN